MKHTSLLVIASIVLVIAAFIAGRAAGYGAGARDTFSVEHPKTTAAQKRADELQHRIDAQFACIGDVKKAIRDNLSGVTLYSLGKVFGEESACNKSSGFGYVNKSDVDALLNAM